MITNPIGKRIYVGKGCLFNDENVKHTDYGTVVDIEYFSGRMRFVILIDRSCVKVKLYESEFEFIEPSIDEDSPFWLVFGMGFLTCSFLIGLYEILHNAKVI